MISHTLKNEGEFKTKHFIVLCAYKTECEPNIDILGVCHSYDEAKILYDKKIKDIRIDAEEWEMDIVTNKECYFEAIGDQWHPSYYMKLYIMEV